LQVPRLLPTAILTYKDPSLHLDLLDKGGRGSVEGCVALSSGDGSIVRGVTFVPSSFGSYYKILSYDNVP
jgi:hypothetical protein